MMTFLMMRVGLIYIYIYASGCSLFSLLLLFNGTILCFYFIEKLFYFNILLKYLGDSKDENAVEYEITVKTADKRTAGTGKFL